jgi:hypothetical protein
MGKKTLPDNTTFDGRWVEGKARGHGIKILPNGTVFEGEWEESRFLTGKCQFPDG